ncbi:MAG: hypothetical protein KAT07_09485, partial [Calditrichia bacterium]|nr:hypothetical protein [Calditrichia bacterium]
PVSKNSLYKWKIFEYIVPVNCIDRDRLHYFLWLILIKFDFPDNYFMLVGGQEGRQRNGWPLIFYQLKLLNPLNRRSPQIIFNKGVLV